MAAVTVRGERYEFEIKSGHRMLLHILHSNIHVQAMTKNFLKSFYRESGLYCCWIVRRFAYG